MQLLPIALAMQSTIEEIRYACGHDLSSHSFGSLYLWQEEMGLSILLKRDWFAVRCRWKGPNAWLFPCGCTKKTARFIASRVHKPDFRLCYMREKDVAFLQREFPGWFQMKKDRDSSEYCYDQQEQRELPGGKFAKLRAKRNRFKRTHDNLRVEPLDAANLHRAKEIAAIWKHFHPKKPKVGFDDLGVMAKAFAHMEPLGLLGVLIQVDGIDVSFALGFPLSHNTFDLCLLKSARRETGLELFLWEALLGMLPKQYCYINTEEDLGIQGLREHKQELKPAFLQELWEGSVALHAR